MALSFISSHEVDIDTVYKVAVVSLFAHVHVSINDQLVDIQLFEIACRVFHPAQKIEKECTYIQRVSWRVHPSIRHPMNTTAADKRTVKEWEDRGNGMRERRTLPICFDC